MFRFQSDFRRRMSFWIVVWVNGWPRVLLGVYGAISCQKAVAPWYIWLDGMTLFGKTHRPAPVLGFPVVGSKIIPSRN